MAGSDSFPRNLDGLVGNRCWARYASVSTRSSVDLHFGAEIRRAQPLRSPGLTDQERHFEGEYGLLFHCAWRLRQGTVVLASSRSDKDRIAELLDALVGRAVTSVSCLLPAYDLVLQFDRDFKLEVFCNQPPGADDNYTFYVRDLAYTVDASLTVEVEGP